MCKSRFNITLALLSTFAKSTRATNIPTCKPISQLKNLHPTHAWHFHSTCKLQTFSGGQTLKQHHTSAALQNNTQWRIVQTEIEGGKEICFTYFYTHVWLNSEMLTMIKTIWDGENMSTTSMIDSEMLTMIMIVIFMWWQWQNENIWRNALPCKIYIHLCKQLKVSWSWHNEKLEYGDGHKEKSDE